MSLLIFTFGLLLLLIGAWGVVSTALKIAAKARISPLIVGITAVAIGTSLPELTVSFFGGIEHATHLALGNIIGSNIANIGLIFALSILSTTTKVGTHKTQSNIHFYFFLTIVMVFVLLTNNLKQEVGFIFIISGFLAILWQVNQGRTDYSIASKEVTKNSNTTNVAITIILFTISLVALIVGGKWIVDYGVILASKLHISETLVGVTAIAIGTSLPELAVTLIGLFKRQPKLVVGNILGSNIFNILFGGGILGLNNANGFDSSVTLIFFTIFSILFSSVLYLYRGKDIPRYFGLIFLGLYFFYLLLLVK